MPDRLADAAADNLAAHFTWVQRRLLGMTVRDDGGFTLTDSGFYDIRGEIAEYQPQ